MKNQHQVSKKKLVPEKQKSSQKWQTGDFSRSVSFQFVLPYQFLLLCKLMEVTPSKVIKDFLENLDCGSWERESREKSKEKLVEYFLEQGYGQQHYTPDEIRKIFIQMDAIGMLFPADASMKVIDHYARWREKYHKYWFKKWFRKPRRKF